MHRSTRRPTARRQARCFMAGDPAAVRELAQWCEVFAGVVRSQLNDPWRASEGCELANEIVGRLFDAGLGEKASEIEPDRWNTRARCIGYLSRWAKDLRLIVADNAMASDEWSEARTPKEWRKHFDSISQSTISRRIADGSLRIQKVNQKLWRIHKSDLDKRF